MVNLATVETHLTPELNEPHRKPLAAVFRMAFNTLKTALTWGLHHTKRAAIRHDNG